MRDVALRKASLMNNDKKLLFAKILKRLPPLQTFACKFNDHRHAEIEQSINRWCLEAEKAMSSPNALRHVANDGPIWVFWWQGLDQAPQIVRACISSIQANCGSREVIVITKDNVEQYADIQDYIYHKLNNSTITLTHFSDILRFSLLHKSGGLWMDATLFVNNPLDFERCFSNFFTCSGYADPTHFFVTEGKWTGFFIGGSQDEPLFEFMNLFFEFYWRDNNQLIDYFLIDYALKYAYDNGVGSLRHWVDAQWGKDNPDLFALEKIVAKQFNRMNWDALTANTNVFKLSWKKPKTYDVDSYGAYILRKYSRNKKRDVI